MVIFFSSFEVRASAEPWESKSDPKHKDNAGGRLQGPSKRLTQTQIKGPSTITTADTKTTAEYIIIMLLRTTGATGSSAESGFWKPN